MIHLTWEEKNATMKVKCTHTNAAKYMVENVLTPGKVYEVINETEEFYFVRDNTETVGGFYKTYFEAV